jgi:hypothetical protein
MFEEHFYSFKTTLLKYLSTGNFLFDTIIGYLLIEILSHLSLDKIWNFLNFNVICNFIKKLKIKYRKYKSISFSKRRIKIMNKYTYRTKYETTNEIEALTYYISKFTKVNHYKFLKEEYNDESSNSKYTEGYLEPSNSVYNIELNYLNNSNDKILLDIIIKDYNEYSRNEGPFNHTFETTYNLYSNNIETLIEFVEYCIVKYNDYLNQQTSLTKYYSLYQGVDFSKYTDKQEYIYLTFPLVASKTFDNVFLPEKKELIKELDFFMNNKDWYKNKGIQHSFGILLKGEPGTGKTSIIKAIANYTKRHILDIPLNKVKTTKELLNIFKDNSNGMIYSNNENEYKKIPRSNSIIVLEDIDCVSDLVLSREFKHIQNYVDSSKKNEHSSPLIEKEYIKVEQIKYNKDDDSNQSIVKSISNNDITLSSLLNVLDGILESNNIIYIITTNYPDKIDKALLRPGRINFTIDFKKADYKIIKEMLEYFYDTKLSEENVYDIKEDTHTTSYVSGLCISYKNDIEKCIEQLK